VTVTLPVSRGASARWEGRRYFREVFWVLSGGDRLYASLYSAPRPTVGVVILPGWGRDGRLLLEWCHKLALGVTKLGGCGVLVQWPGHEDSEGDASALTFDRLVEVVVDALWAGQECFPKARWSLAGIRLGGTAVALAANAARVPTAVLVQPDLNLEAYFDQVARSARLNLLRGDPHPGWGFGTEIPDGLRQPGTAAVVESALASLICRTAVIHYSFPVPEPLPHNVLDITVQGNWWRPPGGDHRLLRHRALEFLGRREASAAS
jgi:hypothetical protein